MLAYYLLIICNYLYVEDTILSVNYGSFYFTQVSKEKVFRMELQFWRS